MLPRERRATQQQLPAPQCSSGSAASAARPGPQQGALAAPQRCCSERPAQNGLTMQLYFKYYSYI
jgi:hypothetical protein